MAGATDYELDLGSAAPAAAFGAQLTAAGQARRLPDGALLVTTVSVPGLTAATRALGAGVALDLTRARPRLSPTDEPAGSVRITSPDGEPQHRQGLSPDQIGYLLRTALAAIPD